MSLKKYLFIFLICIIIFGIYFIYKENRTEMADWVSELGYEDNQLYTLTFNFEGNRGCPEISVALNNKEYRLIFDTGCGSGLALTNVIENDLEFDLIDTVEQLNRDGSHRGWSKEVNLKELSVFNDSFKDIKTVIVDWNMMSSKKINGVIGLDYFEGRIITLDYNGHQIGVKNKPIDYGNLNKDKYVILPLLKTSSKSQESLPFFIAKYKGEFIMVYLDTGKNHSFVYNPNSDSVIGGDVKILKDINLEVGELMLELTELGEVCNIEQASDLPHTTMIELNSDQIWKNNLLITLDLIEGNIIFRKR